MIRHRVFFAALIVAPALGASSRAQPLKCPAPGRDLRPVDLRGRWDLEITADSVVRLPDAKVGRPLAGTLEVSRRDASANVIVYSGRYSARLPSIGLTRDTGEILISVPAGDTTRIILDPSVDHGNLELVGRCESDHLAGTWLRNGAPARAWGRFVLRRR